MDADVSSAEGENVAVVRVLVTDDVDAPSEPDVAAITRFVISAEAEDEP